MVEAAEKFKRYLQRTKNESFEREELGDEHQSVIFRSTIEMQGQYVPVGVIFDDTIYVVVRANIAPKALNDENAYEVSNFITRLNSSNKLFKYYLAPDTSVILDACIPMTKENYSAELINMIVGVVAREVQKHHGDFMRLIWHKG